MSQPPNQPYGAHPPPPYAAPPPRRPRPRARWFVVGGVLLVLAPVAFVGALLLTLRPLMAEDAVFAADGQSHQVRLPAGEERAIYVDGASADTTCEVTDGAGDPVDLRSPGGDFTYNEWEATAVFDTGDGDTTFTCTGSDPTDRVRIASVPSVGGLIGGVVGAVLLPLLLGLAGLITLVVTGVLWATGAPRAPRGTDPGAGAL